MKKTVSLILALVLCLALAAPALAVETIYDDGDQRVGGHAYYLPGAGPAVTSVADGMEDGRAILPGAAQGVGPWGTLDASMTFSPSPEAIPSATDIYYEVHDFDTLPAIAFAFYGRSDLAQALYDANVNGHFLISGGRLESQRPLRIPTSLKGVARLDIQNPLKIGDINFDGKVDAIEYDNVMRDAIVRPGDYGGLEITWDEFYWNFYPVTHFQYTILWNSTSNADLGFSGVRYGTIDGEDGSRGPSYTWTTFGPLDVNSIAFWPVDQDGNIVTPAVIDKQNGFWNEQQVYERCGQIVYIVRKGDTLNSIAKMFYAGNGVNTYYTNNAQHLINAIKAANVGRISGDVVTAGQYIILPVISIGY